MSDAPLNSDAKHKANEKPVPMAITPLYYFALASLVIILFAMS